MRRLFLLSNISFLLALLSACQMTPLDVSSNVVDREGLSAKPTFAIRAHTEKPGAYIDLLNSSIENMLIEKGYTSSDKPDVVVVYQVSFVEGTELQIKSTPVWTTVYTKPELEAVYEASILINAIDAKSGRVLWKAASLRDLTQVDTQSYSAERADKAAASLFESYPEFEGQ